MDPMDNMMEIVMANTILLEQDVLAMIHFQATHHQPVQELGECFQRLLNPIVLQTERLQHHFKLA
jgi:hypothetical protein